LIFSEDDMDAMLSVRAAFDPSGLCNPGKIIPLPKGCGEARAVATQSLSEPAAVATGSIENLRTPARTGTGFTRGRLAERINEVRLANEIKQIVGPLNLQKLVPGQSGAQTESSWDRERAVVAAPATVAELAAVLDVAQRDELSVIPAGDLRWIDAGNNLSKVDLILTTRRMSKMIRHEPADLVATAEAGLTLRELQEQLARGGQWLPVDPPDDGTATLGGVVATGLSGPQALVYGALRSFVIGMRVVLANGREIKAGGNVVKNVAGYDLCKLFTGSYGTLGLITEVTFKLRPLPAERRTIAAFGSRESLFQAGGRIVNQFFPAAAELISPRLVEQLAIGGKAGNSGLLIRFAGSARAVVTQTAQALKLLQDASLVCETVDNDLLLWKGLGAASLQPSADLSWRVAVPPKELAAFASDPGVWKSFWPPL